MTGAWCARLRWSPDALRSVLDALPPARCQARMLAWLTEGGSSVPYPSDLYASRQGGTLTAEMLDALLAKVYENGRLGPSQAELDYWVEEGMRLRDRYLAAVERERRVREEEAIIHGPVRK